VEREQKIGALVLEAMIQRQGVVLTKRRGVFTCAKSETSARRRNQLTATGGASTTPAQGNKEQMWALAENTTTPTKNVELEEGGNARVQISGHRP